MSKSKWCITLLFLFLSYEAFSEEIPNSLEQKQTSFVLDGEIDGALSLTSILSKRDENIPDSVRNRFPVGFNKRTKFSVLSKGGLANRFYIDVDYKKDDTNIGADEDSKILVRYLGRPGELLESLELGDTTLDLPGARWLSLKGKTGKVSRQSFAGKGTLSYRDMKMIFLGSHQKGKPETEYFTVGSNVQKVREIADVDYVQRRFYSLAPPDDLPLDPQSVLIFYDDGNGLNNTAATQKFVPQGATKEGSFDLLIPNDISRGYELDARTGSVRFLFEVPFNGTLVVSYRTTFGKEVIKKLIKSDDDTLNAELKNRYLLPKDFLDIVKVSILDKSSKESELPPFQFDTLRGLLVFQSTRPFSSEVYQFPPSHTKMIVLNYLSTSEKSSFRLSKEPLLDSVKVEKNGEKLVQGTDYEMTPVPGSAEVVLYNARANDRVVVSYNGKDVPQVRQTVGAGLLFGEGKPISMGLSGLYDFEPRSTRVPTIGNDSSQLKMFGLSLKGDDEFWKTKFKVNLEAAGSQYNPNPYGASMVDSMDQSRRYSSVDIREDLWKVSAKPLSAQGLRSGGRTEFGSIFLRDIIPSYPSEKRVQFFSFESETGKWFGMHRSLSPKKGAFDLRQFRFIEMFVHSESLGGKFYVELGDVSEDINGNGKLDTEDANHDGLVDQSEDSGLGLENGTQFGAGNNLLDTEDIDLDGRLSISESVNQETVELNWTGWKKLRFSLKGASSARYLRVWSKDSSKVKVAQIVFTGVEYSEESSPGSGLISGTVSSFSDPDAPTLINHSTFKRLYPERNVDKIDKSEFERERLEDFALSIEYTVLPSGIVSAKKDVHIDFTDQKEIHFFAASTAATQAVLFLRFGDTVNYFEFDVAISQLASEYKEFSIDRSRFRVQGQPDWQNIREIRIGIKNPGSATQSGKLFINELFVDQPIVREAFAYSGESEIVYPVMSLYGVPSNLLGKNGELFVEGSLTQIPKDFRTPDEYLRGQKQYKVKGGWRSNVSAFQYTREYDIQNEIKPNNGPYSRRLNESVYQSNKLDWTLKPKYLDWQTGVTGTYEKKDRSELNLKERLEILANRMDYTNTRLPDWAPKIVFLDSLYSNDLFLQRHTVGSSLEQKWMVFDGALSVTPKIGFEDTYVSSSNFAVSKKSVSAVNLNSVFSIYGKQCSMNLNGSSENKLLRSDYPSLNLSKSMRSEIKYDFGIFGQSSVHGTLSESRVFTSTTALENPNHVWTFQLSNPVFEPQSLTQAHESGVEQNNLRLSRIIDFDDFDWFSLTGKASLRKETNRFLGTGTQYLTVRFPELYLTLSTGPWHCSLGGTIEKGEGVDRFLKTENYSLTFDYKAGIWELKNSFNQKSEVQKQFGIKVLGIEVQSYKTSLKVNLGNPVFQSVKLLRKNILLENRLSLYFSGEYEQRKGEQTSQPILEHSLKFNQRSEYFIRKGFKTYLSFEAWHFQNRLASSQNYLAYTVILGLNSVF